MKSTRQVPDHGDIERDKICLADNLCPISDKTNSTLCRRSFIPEYPLLLENPPGENLFYKTKEQLHKKT